MGLYELKGSYRLLESGREECFEVGGEKFELSRRRVEAIEADSSLDEGSNACDCNSVPHCIRLELRLQLDVCH